MKDEELLARDTSRLQRAVASKLEAPVDHPSFIALVGLPGSGKSYFAAKLIERIPAVVLESDFLRKELVRRPVYSQFESFRLFKAIHRLITELLAAGYNVILDATNLSEDSRRPLYSIAGETGAKAIVVHMNTPRELAEERLSGRLLQRDGYSDANWAVYQKLETDFEPITGPHYEITGAMDISPIIDKIVAEVLQKE
jgi:predicted kinase